MPLPKLANLIGATPQAVGANAVDEIEQECDCQQSGFQVCLHVTRKLKQLLFHLIRSCIAGINRLLDNNQKKGNREYNFNISTLELAADASGWRRSAART